MRTALAYILGAAALLSVSSTQVSAQCGGGFAWIGYFLDRPEVSAIFDGTILDIQRRELALVVTFEVNRVWKGDVTKRQVVYRGTRLPIGQRSGSSTRLKQFEEVGKRHIVIAHQLTEIERVELGLTSTDTANLATGFCGDGSRPVEVAGSIDALGPGRAPR
jgi:hypothetical protein